MERYLRVLDDMERLLDEAMEIARKGTAAIRELEEMGVFKLLIMIDRGEVIVLRKDEAVCPICGYEF